MTADVGDGWASRARTAEDYAALVSRELADTRLQAAGYLQLVETYLQHHREHHHDCEGYL